MQPVDAADDWATLWQSELAALAVDPEWRERLGAWAAFVATLPGAALPAVTSHDRHDGGPGGRAGADAPPGTAPAVDASGAALDHAAELDRLRNRIAELERGAPLQPDGNR